MSETANTTEGRHGPLLRNLVLVVSYLALMTLIGVAYT